MKALNFGLAALITPLFAVQTLAADLGGSCCADLEERVAELEATVARKGNRKVTLTVYGQVHQAVLFHDIEGAPRDKTSVINGAHSTSRFGFRGQAKINSNWTAGYLIEIGVGGFEERTGATTGDLAVRYSSLFIKSKQFGTMHLGRTSMATDGIVEVDLSNSAVATVPLSLAPMDSALIGVSLSPFDGGRADAIRYVSPTVGGFSLSAAWANEDAYDVALRFANEFGAIRVAAGVGYRKDDGPLGLVPDTKSYLASGSIMHTTSGLFVSGSYGRQDLDGIGNLEGYAVRGGVETKTFPIGKTTLFAEWGRLNVPTFDETPNMYGVGIVQAIDPAAMDLYASYRRFDDDGLVGLGTQDIILMGARIKF